MADVKSREYLEYLINTYSDMVYRLAISRTKNKEKAEDVYQEVFLRLSKNIPDFESKEHEKAWLIRVTINCSKNVLLDKFARSTEELKEDIIFETEERSIIYYAVLGLPQKDRTIIHLFYYEGYKTVEIGSMLNMNENTVKSILKRARIKLKSTVRGGLEDE